MLLIPWSHERQVNDLVAGYGFSVLSFGESFSDDVYDDVARKSRKATWPERTSPALQLATLKLDLRKEEGDNNEKMTTTNETTMKVVIEAGDDCHMPYNSIRLFDSIQKSTKFLFIDPLGPCQTLSFVPVISVEESRIFSLILGDIGPQIGL